MLSEKRLFLSDNLLFTKDLLRNKDAASTLYIFSKSRQSDEGEGEATSRSFNAEFGKIYKARRVGSEEAVSLFRNKSINQIRIKG
jgi:hypothetical protein